MYVLPGLYGPVFKNRLDMGYMSFSKPIASRVMGQYCMVRGLLPMFPRIFCIPDQYIVVH